MSAGGTIELAMLTAPDISCGHCVATLKETVGGLAGIDRVDADADAERVEVAIDANRVSIVEIEAALREPGYPVQKE